MALSEPCVVYIAANEMEALVVKAKLEAAGIPVALQYESAGRVYGLTVNGLAEVKILVPQKFETQARQLLHE